MTRAPERGTEGRLVIGSRRSRLARLQAEWVGDRLREACPGLSIAYRTMTTEGDRQGGRPLPEIGGKGVFTADLERALAEGRVDLAVHSLKDVPTELDAAFDLHAIPAREDPRDLLVPRSGLTLDGIEDLARGAVVGTSSLRRAAQVRAARPDLEVVPIRGNVETRLSRLDSGACDALILAAAGLLRLGIERPGAVILSPPAWLPAPGQGALGVQGRAADGATRRLAVRIEDPGARAAAEAERAFLGALHGGCRVPVGGLARIERDRVRLEGAVYAVAGADPRVGPDAEPIRGVEEGALSEARAVGERLAVRLIDRGARDLVALARGDAPGAGERG